MAEYGNRNNLLYVLEGFVLDNSEDIAMEVAENFRRRRVEKNITRPRNSTPWPNSTSSAVNPATKEPILKLKSNEKD